MTFDIDDLGLPKKVLSTLSNSIRVNILKLLSRQSPLTFTQIMQTMNLEPSSDAGRFGYHLRELKNSDLIKGDESGYFLTELGEKVVEFIWSLIDYTRSEIIKEIPVRTSEYAIEHFDRIKITEALIREAKVPKDLADEIAKDAEEQLMKANVKYLTAPLIREVVNSILVLKGHEQYRHNLTRLGLPPYEISRLITDSAIRPLNSNPISIQTMLSDAVLEQYLLLNVLPHEVADAHLRGDISIPNANNFILCPNSIQHDIRPFLSEGLHALKDSLAVSLNPPKSFYQALMLSAKIIEISHIQSSGVQSIDFFNIFLAPYVKGLSRAEIKEHLRLFFNELGSNYAGIRGDFPYSTLNINLEIPHYLLNASIAGLNNGIYGDFIDEALLIVDLIIELLLEGASDGKPYFLPHQVFKIQNTNLNDPELTLILQKLFELIIKWGTPILANLTPEWQHGNVNYTGLFDRLDSSWKEDFELDSLRTGNLDCIFINLPRIAYESKQDEDKYFELLEEKIKLVTSALNIKRNQIYTRIFEDHLLPLFTYQIKGENYFHLEHATNAISYIGLPEATEIQTNSKISTKTGLKFAQKLIEMLHNIVQEHSNNTGFRWVLRQPYSDNWIDRHLQLDKKRFVKEISKSQYQYYNTANINSDFPLSLSEKIKIESAFHKLLLGGHLLEIPLSETSNSIESLREWIKKISNSSIGLFTFAHDFAYCAQCGKAILGTPKKCLTCNTTQNVSYFNKLMAPYRPFMRLSKSERYEIQNRQKFSL